MSATEFSIRACYGANAAAYCPHTLDEMGSQFNHPGSYQKGTFDNCDSDSGHFPNVFRGSTFHQGDAKTPNGHKPAATFNCRPFKTVKNGPAKQTPYRRSEPARSDFEDVN